MTERHLHVVPDPGPWQSKGACVDQPSDLWFDDEVGFSGDERGAAAVAICNVCPVRIDCLAHAISNNEQYGIWGGQTAKERTAARRRERDHRAVVASANGPTPPARKRCPRCERTKPSAEWGKDRSSSDGLGSYCRECARIVHAINDEKRRHRRTG